MHVPPPPDFRVPHLPNPTLPTLVGSAPLDASKMGKWKSHHLCRNAVRNWSCLHDIESTGCWLVLMFYLISCEGLWQSVTFTWHLHLTLLPALQDGFSAWTTTVLVSFFEIAPLLCIRMLVVLWYWQRQSWRFLLSPHTDKVLCVLHVL